MLNSACVFVRCKSVLFNLTAGQYNKDKPYDYYDKMADACLKDIADMSEKTKSGKDIKQSDFSSKKDTNSGNSK